MIKFEDLRVSDGHLIISAKVKEIDNYYDNVYIDKVKIDSQNTFNPNGPSSSLIYESDSFAANTKSITLDLTANDFVNVDMNKTMFFIYITTTGTPAVNTPCGMDKTPTLGVAFSLCPIFNETLACIRELDNKCDLPKSFINKILQFKAIQYSIDTEHYNQAIIYYNKFYKLLDAVTPSQCNCNG